MTVAVLLLIGGAPRRVSECADYIFRLSHRGDCP